MPDPRAAALDSSMSNVLASKLGDIARAAMSPEQLVGDSIDRGLILRRLLSEGGFELRVAAVEQAAPEGEICGQSATTVSLGMKPERTGGCGRPITNPAEVFRCLDCAVPFHKNCLIIHCDENSVYEHLADARAAIREAADALTKMRKCNVAHVYESNASEMRGFVGVAKEHFDEAMKTLARPAVFEARREERG